MIRASYMFLVALALCSIDAGMSNAATITVTGTGDSVAVDGVVTLREAITSINAGANANADVVAVGAYGTADTINFNIAGAGTHTILLTGSSLPSIVKPLTINGYSQPGSAANSAATGDNSIHLIVIDGSGAGVANCLTLTTGSSSSTIRGLVINHCTNGIGLFINDGQNDVIAGNFIGTNAAGTAAVGNSQGGVAVGNIGTNISGTTIGGSAVADRNVISGNSFFQLFVGEFNGTANNVVVQNNYVGTNAAGTAGLGGGNGLQLDTVNSITVGGASNSLGGSCSGTCNLLAGNGGGDLSTSTGGVPPPQTYTIQGNFIGTDVTGTAALSNGSQPGVTIGGGNNSVTIGGTAPGVGNLISGHGTTRPGIFIAGAPTTCTIQGNFIGTTTTGNAVLGNGGAGIENASSPNVTIGGTTAAARNVIGGNGNGVTPKGPGILVEGLALGADLAATVIQGNNIGIGADMASNIGNIGDGIDIVSTSQGSTIGALTTGGLGGNIIAFNGAGRTNGAGVGVANSSQAKIFSNSIFSNTGTTTGIGIDLSATNVPTDGPTANDNCDGDAGGNNLQNFPVLTSASTNGANIQIAGSLNSTASTTFTIEFFSDTPGSQARTFLGSTSATTNGACTAAINANLATVVPVGVNITATATDPSGCTSEISAPVVSTAPPVDLTISKTHVGNFTQGDTGKTYTITISNVGANPSSGLVTLSDSLPPGLIARSLGGSGWTCDPIPAGGTAGPATLNCTRSDALAAGSYPQITLTVDVACNAPASVTNTATVSGGGDASPGNNAVNDPTTVNPENIPPVISCPGGITKFTDSGQLSATVNPGTPVATDNCGVPTVTGVRSDGKPLNAPYPIGVTLITWTAKDAANHTSSCTQTIVVMAPSGRRRIP